MPLVRRWRPSPRTVTLSEKKKENLMRLLLVQSNLFFSLGVIFAVAAFDPSGPSSWFVWYVFISNLLLNIYAFGNTDIFSPQHVFPAYYCLVFTSGDLFY